MPNEKNIILYTQYITDQNSKILRETCLSVTFLLLLHFSMQSWCERDEVYGVTVF
jgi:hypothetical protein